MKKSLAMLFSVLFLLSTVFMACSNGNTDNVGEANKGPSTTALGTGQIMGYVLDNRGAPVEGATVTLGTKTAKTNAGGEFVITDVSVNDANLITTGSSVKTGTLGTGYTLTAVKEGYIPAKVSGVFITYEEIQTDEAAAYKKALDGLQTTYKDLLTSYANATATGSSTTDTTVTGNTADTVTTTTTSTSTSAEEVFKKIADAIAGLVAKYGEDSYYTNYFSSFANATMIPCDASFAGSVKLNTTTKGASEISGKTYKPSAREKAVVATYLPTNGSNANYHWYADIDENGYFKFDSCLPSGVNVTFSLDSFFETIEGKEYVFSSESADLIIENSGATNVFASTGSNSLAMNAVNGQKSAVFMLYAQNDKIWITDSNIPEATSGTLLPSTEPLVFKFNKPMKKVELTAAGIKDILEKNITTEFSDEYKTATITPNDGNWTFTSNGTGAITVSGEAVDGSKTFINSSFTAFFDTKIWVGIDTTKGNTFDDVDGYLSLKDSITLTFSKAMEYADLSISNVSNMYKKEWSEDKKSLTITPDPYWDLTTGNAVTFSVAKNGNTNLAKAADGTDEIQYWKTHSTAAGIVVYFDNYVDVTLDDISTTSNEAFTITFSKALKNFIASDNLTVEYWDTTLTTPGWAPFDLYKDYTAEIDSTGKVITVKATEVSKDVKVFNQSGKYQITLTDLEAEDGSDQFRELGKYTATSTKFTTDFAYDGYVLKVKSIAVIDAKDLPSTAQLSRAAQIVTTDQLLKITFTKAITKSNIKVGVDDEAPVSTDNYIDSVDPSIVYVPLKDVSKVGGKVVLNFVNNVTSYDSDTIKAEPTAKELAEYFGYDLPDFYVYAALNLEGSSLIDSRRTASNKWKHTVNDPVNSGDPITFTFNDVADKVTWTLYVNDAGNGKYVDSGNATLSTETVDGKERTVASITTSKLIADAEKAAINDDGVRITTYYIDLAASKDGVTVFNTTNAYFPSDADDTFENDGIRQIFVPAATADNASIGLKCGTIQIEVKPVVLEGTNLVDTTKEKVVDVAAKSDVTFTFNSLAANYTAEYELLNAAGIKIDSGVATKVGNVVTVPGSKLIIDDENATAENRTTAYEIVLKIKDANDVVVFSTEENFPSTENKTFEKEIAANGKYAALAGTNGGIKFNVKPILLDGISLVDEAKEEIVDVAAKTNVVFTFDAAVTGFTADYQILDANGLKVAKGEATVSGNTVTVPGTKLVIDNDNAAAANRTTAYEIVLTVKDADDKVAFTTASNFPLDLEDAFEKDLIAGGKYNALIGTNGGIKVNVKPLLLEETSLVDTVKKEVVDVAAKSNVTFTFDAALAGYTAEYKLLDNAGVELAEGAATIGGQTVTVPGTKLVIDNDSAVAASRTTTYEIVLTIKDADDKVAFTTESKFPLDLEDAFEKDLISGGKYNALIGTNGGIKFNVKPILLSGISLVDEEKEEIVDVAAKTDVAFTFDSPVTGFTADYQILDNAGARIAKGEATVSGNTVTVPGTKLVIDNDSAAAASRITTYEIVLTVKDADDKVAFTTASNFPLNLEDAFEKDLITGGKYNALIGANGGIKVNVKPLLLTYTSLIDPVKETVLDVAAKSNVTFTFDAALTGYTAEYKLIDATGATVETDEAAIAGQTVTVHSDKMVIDNDNANTTTRTTAYEIVLTIKDADDKVAFTTESNFPLNLADSFEQELTTGGTYAALVGTNSGIALKVKPLVLTATNLVDTTEETIVDVDAKANVTFTFDAALTDYTAEYRLLSANGATVDSGEATIADQTVTVQNDKMVIDTANAPATTGLTQYEIVLTLKDADDKVAFTTVSNFPLSLDDSLEELMTTGGTYAALVGSNQGIKFNVKPISIEEIDVLLEEGTTFGDANGTFSAKAPVLPGSAITIKFSSALPVGAKVEYEVFEMNSSSVLEALGGDNAEKALPLLTAATDTISISSTDMVADVADDKYYYILIRVKKGEEILFTTESNFFGAASDYEAALNTAGFVDTTNGKLKVKVVESKVITFANDNTSVTTTSADFQESLKSNIVLQFSHPVTGYKAVLYDDTAKVFVKYVNAATQFTALSSTAPVSTYAEWTAANEEYIYASTSTVSGNVITIIPTNYLSASKTVKIALFNANNEFVDVKFDDNNALQYTTAATWDISEAIATATVKAPNTAATEIGNGAAVKFEFDTAYSSVTNNLAKYTIYVKNAETDTYSVSTAATEGVDENGTSLAGTAGVTTYRLGRAAKTYVSTAALDDDAFKYGGHVNVAIVKELDGVKTVYKAELVDGKASTLNITTTPGTVISGFTQINTSNPNELKTNVTSVALECDDSTTNQAQNIDFVLNITSNEWIKTITATVTGQENTNAGLGSSDHKATVANPVVAYSTANPTTATITFDDAYWFIDDEISIVVKDTSNNEATYTIKIK